MGVGGRRPNTISPAVKDRDRIVDPSQAGGYIVAFEPPDELSKGGRDIWETITPELVKGRVLRMDDIPILIEACEAWALTRTFRRQLWKAVQMYEEVAENEPKDPAEFEAWSAKLDAASAVVKRTRSAWVAAYRVASSAAGDLGLGPTARVRLGLAQVQGQSLLESLTEGASFGSIPGQGDSQ